MISPAGSRVVHLADQETDDVFNLHRVPIMGDSPGQTGTRSGSWVNSLSNLQSSSRSFGSPAFEASVIGFRIAAP